MDEKIKVKPFDSFSHGDVTGAMILDIRRSKESGLYPIRYRITFQRKTVYYKSGYDASADDWNRLPDTKKPDLIEMRSLLRSGFEIIENHVKAIKDTFSFDSLNRRIGRGKVELVSGAFDDRIVKLNGSGQVGTASIYNSAKIFFLEYKVSLKLADITPKLLESIENYAIQDRKPPLTYATLSIYLRCLRALCNIAMQDGTITQTHYPFQRIQNDGKYSIKEGSGTKIALTLDQLRRFIDFETPFRGIQKSKDIFLLSFHLGGINIKDLLLLRWENIKGDELIYIRSKTARTSKKLEPIRIPLTRDTLQLIYRYCNPDRSPNARILPYMPEEASPVEIRHITLNVVRNINRDLYKIARKLKIEGLSSYVARHSVATLMKNSGTPESFIKEMLGHRDIKTTQNYLKSFEPAQRREIFERAEENFKDAMNKLKVQEHENAQLE
jgi:integrase